MSELEPEFCEYVARQLLYFYVEPQDKGRLDALIAQLRRLPELLEAESRLDELAEVVGKALCVRTLCEGEELADPGDHALVSAMLATRDERDRARHMAGLWKELARDLWRRGCDLTKVFELAVIDLSWLKDWKRLFLAQRAIVRSLESRLAAVEQERDQLRNERDTILAWGVTDELPPAEVMQALVEMGGSVDTMALLKHLAEVEKERDQLRNERDHHRKWLNVTRDHCIKLRGMLTLEQAAEFESWMVEHALEAERGTKCCDVVHGGQAEPRPLREGTRGAPAPHEAPSIDRERIRRVSDALIAAGKAPRPAKQTVREGARAYVTTAEGEGTRACPCGEPAIAGDQWCEDCHPCEPACGAPGCTNARGPDGVCDKHRRHGVPLREGTRAPFDWTSSGRIADRVIGCIECGKPCALVGQVIPSHGRCQWCRRGPQGSEGES